MTLSTRFAALLVTLLVAHGAQAASTVYPATFCQTQKSVFLGVPTAEHLPFGSLLVRAPGDREALTAVVCPMVNHRVSSGNTMAWVNVQVPPNGYSITCNLVTATSNGQSGSFSAPSATTRGAYRTEYLHFYQGQTTPYSGKAMIHCSVPDGGKINTYKFWEL